jgi:hypothetical protein
MGAERNEVPTRGGSKYTIDISESEELSAVDRCCSPNGNSRTARLRGLKSNFASVEKRLAE